MTDNFDFDDYLATLDGELMSVLQDDALNVRLTKESVQQTLSKSDDTVQEGGHDV